MTVGIGWRWLAMTAAVAALALPLLTARADADGHGDDPPPVEALLGDAQPGDATPAAAAAGDAQPSEAPLGSAPTDETDETSPAPQPTLLLAGSVVGLAGTPHLWVIGEDGLLHWAGDTRALADHYVRWDLRLDLSLPELTQLASGDPWLTAGLLREAGPISLVKWETHEPLPRLLHVQCIRDLEIFGINADNYGRFVLERPEWEQRYGISVVGLARAPLASTCVPASGGPSGAGGSGGGGGGASGSADSGSGPQTPPNVPTSSGTSGSTGSTGSAVATATPAAQATTAPTSTSSGGGSNGNGATATPAPSTTPAPSSSAAPSSTATTSAVIGPAGVVSSQGTDSSGRLYVIVEFQDTASGLESITVVCQKNATVDVAAFARGTRNPVRVRVTVQSPARPGIAILNVRSVAGQTGQFQAHLMNGPSATDC